MITNGRVFQPQLTFPVAHAVATFDQKDFALEVVLPSIYMHLHFHSAYARLLSHRPYAQEYDSEGGCLRLVMVTHQNTWTHLRYVCKGIYKKTVIRVQMITLSRNL